MADQRVMRQYADRLPCVPAVGTASQRKGESVADPASAPPGAPDRSHAE